MNKIEELITEIKKERITYNEQIENLREINNKKAEDILVLKNQLNETNRELKIMTNRMEQFKKAIGEVDE